MCSRPITQGDFTFACRTCDECIATRRHGWVARAMAEKTDHSHCLVIALTYSDETEIGRQGAQMFCYADVRAFFARLRAAARRHFKKKRMNAKPVIRFLVAGEQGDRYGRCHWHMIVYSNVDLSKLGEVRGRYRVLSRLEDMLTIGKRKRRLNWSLWPYGFVTFQEPDQAGMAYVLSYCLKDQFIQEKSEGTMREAKSENFATGLFRMSKRPAIGEAFLYRKMQRLEHSSSVLPSLNISIPDFGGYWQPSGSFRKKLLWALRALNTRIRWATGADAPQWSSLLASCADNEADMDILNGKKTEEPEETFEFELAKRQRLAAAQSADREFAHRCGASIACDNCLHELSEAALLERGIKRYEGPDGVWQYTTLDGRGVSLSRKRGVGINPDCLEKGSKQARRVFPASAG